MKRRLYLIGNIFQQNQALQAYILRSIETGGAKVDTIEFFDEADREFFSELEYRTKYKNQIYVVTHKKSFTLVGKLLCTLLDDKLVLKGSSLIPSSCETHDGENYLVNIGESVINVITVQESAAMTTPLLSSSDAEETLHFFEHPIKEVIAILRPLAKQFDVNLTFSQLVEHWVEVKVTCNTYGSTHKFLAIAKERYPAHVIVSDDLVRHIIDKCVKSDRKVTLAESCTGGLLAYYFTSHSGVSSIFEGSLVTYSNILKENWLAVENSTLVEHGAVSEALVKEMCEGALAIANADYALAISGVAGPDGGTSEKPVGTVVIGCASKHSSKIVTCHFEGDRKYIQQQSALTALKMLVLGDKKVFFRN